MPWVKALGLVRHPDNAGTMLTYYPGQWLDVTNRQMLALLIAERKVELAPGVHSMGVLALNDCGVVATDAASASLRLKATGLPVSSEFALTYPRTLFWDTALDLRLDLLAIAFHRLETGWQVAAPLWKYAQLASNIGTEDARARTQAIIHDLRVLVYETRAVLVRRCSDTAQLLEQWQAERASGDDDRLCFMRAIYICQPAICALPVGWFGK